MVLPAELCPLPSPYCLSSSTLSLQAARSPAPYPTVRGSQHPPSLTTQGLPAAPPAPKVLPPPGARPPDPCLLHSSRWWALLGSQSASSPPSIRPVTQCGGHSSASVLLLTVAVSATSPCPRAPAAPVTGCSEPGEARVLSLPSPESLPVPATTNTRPSLSTGQC